MEQNSELGVTHGMAEIQEEPITAPVKMGGGLRYNKGKARMSLVPSSLNYAVAKVLEFGAKKYAEHNWRQGMRWCKDVAEPLERHFKKWLDGEECDEESGLPHLWHIACNVAMLIEYAETYPDGDDRFKGAINRYQTSFEKYEMKDPKAVKKAVQAFVNNIRTGGLGCDVMNSNSQTEP